MGNTKSNLENEKDLGMTVNNNVANKVRHGKARDNRKDKNDISQKELNNRAGMDKNDNKKEFKSSKNDNSNKDGKKKANKFDAIKESNHKTTEIKVEHEIPLKDKISTVKRCKLNIPPFSKIPEPEYKIKLLVDENYEGPFRLILRKNPCILELTSIDGLTLKLIKKSDILFIQTLKNEILKLFIKSVIDEEGNGVNDVRGGDVETIMVIFKFVNQKDCESFEFFFPSIFGIVLHSDKVKIPVADYVEFGDYIIGSNKNILKRMDEYKELSKSNVKYHEYDDDSENDMDDNKLLNLYEEKMVQQERDFFTRKDLVIKYVDDSFLSFEGSSSANGDSNSLSTESVNENDEKNAEKYSKLFPISISGQSESSEIITFKDISPIGNKYKAEVIEWRLSLNIGGTKCLFSELPISVSKTFQINDEHVSFRGNICSYLVAI
ncbi:hypothetical protein FG379_002877 [Cryptosporidium bovis]|uniref:uncharacterized protein n=1 Tax=Cryptosporidium bovis TaxID=310047 RepID=UPI00351A6711|nr:hypothetical protein FG379_002877 [Cryptosporidium bovis]